MASDDVQGGYSAVAELYRAAGWQGVLPLPPGRKESPPAGFTGHGAPDPSDEQVAAWSAAHEGGNVALRLPDGVVGIDLDAYRGGDVTYFALVEELGSLPPTWVSTSRDDGSGIHLYRVPPGTRLRGAAGEGVDVIQHHHRYAVAWPSVHPSGAAYRWETADVFQVSPPQPDELPDLPQAWLEHLRDDRPADDRADVDLRALLGGMRPGPPCQAVREALERWAGAVDEGGESRHDLMTRAVLALLRLGDEDHAGAARALGDLRAAFVTAVTADGSRGDTEAVEEFGRALAGAARIVAAEPGERDGDPCEETPGERQTRQLAELVGMTVEQVHEQQRRRGYLAAPGNPLPNARAFVAERHTVAGGPTLVAQGGQFREWDGRVWPELEDAGLRARLYAWLEDAEYLKEVKGEFEPVPFQPSRGKVTDLVDALRAVAHLPATTVAPVWLDTGQRADALVTASGVLDLTTRALSGHTPRLYVHAAVPYAYDPRARAPAWEAFLETLWPDDAESVETLQEWFGYVLSGATALQKGLFLIGPPRAGKGTIARVLSALIGSEHVAGPTLAGLGGAFGLSQLLGKPLAVIADARLRQADDIVTERLLAVMGEDAQTVDRKHREPVHVRLPTRFMLMSNEVPRFADASGALASRFVVLVLGTSFLGREDTGLAARLAGEMAGILNWALDGLDRLRARGRLRQPQASAEVIAELEELSSPVLAFVRERCDVGPETHTADLGALWAAWQDWAEDNGRMSGSVQAFGRDLRAAVPTLSVSRPRVGGRQQRVYHGIRLRHLVSID